MASGETISATKHPTLLGESIDVRASSLLLATTYRPFVALLLITVLLDAISTVAFMSVVGPGAEANPIVRFLAFQFGSVGGTLLGKLVQLFAAFGFAVIAPRLIKFVLSTVILMNLLAFVVNMHVSVLGR